MATSFGFTAFAKRMRVISDKFGENVGDTVREAALAADATAVLATPVDTGRARGNWRVDIGNPVFDFDENAVDPSGSQAISQGRQVITSWEVGRGPIFISNSVPYIVPLDEGRSAQAPNGMSAAATQAANVVLSRARLLDGV